MAEAGQPRHRRDRGLGVEQQIARGFQAHPFDVLARAHAGFLAEQAAEGAWGHMRLGGQRLDGADHILAGADAGEKPRALIRAFEKHADLLDRRPELAEIPVRLAPDAATARAWASVENAAWARLRLRGWTNMRAAFGAGGAEGWADGWGDGESVPGTARAGSALIGRLAGYNRREHKGSGRIFQRRASVRIVGDRAERKESACNSTNLSP